MSDPNLKMDGLDAFIKILKGKPSVLKIGILQDTASRAGKINNATIGAVHEYGTATIPQRSFLRQPLAEHLSSYVENSNVFGKDTFKQVIAKKSFVPYLQKIGIIGETVVSDAFNSGGFGKWPAWKNPGYENNTGMLLIDSQQLRNSITSAVVEG